MIILIKILVILMIMMTKITEKEHKKLLILCKILPFQGLLIGQKKVSKKFPHFRAMPELKSFFSFQVFSNVGNMGMKMIIRRMFQNRNTKILLITMRLNCRHTKSLACSCFSLELPSSPSPPLSTLLRRSLFFVFFAEKVFIFCLLS